MATASKRKVHELPRINILQIVETKEDLLPVAAYARVSTEKEQQEDSFERQVEHYTQMIAANAKWRMVEVYADPGISGTRAEKRPNFLRMIQDCRDGKIKKILVKSISRFARNTVDALQYIRELRDLGISIYFENENIDTMSTGGEVLITILAAMAEQESRTISTNIKWAWQRKFQNGEIILNTGMMLGYRRLPEDDENGMAVYEINEEEAEIVRRIYREYNAGITVTRICRGLEADGIRTKLGKTKWQHSVIMSILTNEKYTGNALLGKTYKQDIMSKGRKKNDGSMSPMYYVENTHPAIIDLELFEMTKREIQRRKDAADTTVGGSRYTSKYPFSGLLVCGICGSRLRRHVRTVGTRDHVPAWGCALRIKEGRSACDSRHVREDVLERTYLAAIKQMTDNAEVVIEAVTEGAMLAMEPENREKLDAIEQAIIAQQEKVLQLHRDKVACRITVPEYEAGVKECGERIHELEAKREELQNCATRYTEVKAWLNAFRDGMQSGEIMSANDALVMKELVEQIIVHDDHIEVQFKCGASVEQTYVK